MTNFRFSGLLLIASLSMNTYSEITIDGVLDEPEWKNARLVSNFYEVYPYSLEEVKDYKTEILILETKEGLFFGFKNFQSNESMRVMNHLRDQERSLSDKNGFSIDFDGDGVEGYNFFISFPTNKC